MRWTIPNILTVMRLLAAPGVAFAFVVFDRPYADWIAFGLFIVACGATLTMLSYWFSAAFHAYQAELFPTRARATGVGFTYSWSRLSAAVSSLVIGALLAYGVGAVVLLITAAWIGVAAIIGVFGPRTNAVPLEVVSR